MLFFDVSVDVDDTNKSRIGNHPNPLNVFEKSNFYEVFYTGMVRCYEGSIVLLHSEDNLFTKKIAPNSFLVL